MDTITLSWDDGSGDSFYISPIPSEDGVTTNLVITSDENNTGYIRKKIVNIITTGNPPGTDPAQVQLEVIQQTDNLVVATYGNSISFNLG